MDIINNVIKETRVRPDGSLRFRLNVLIAPAYTCEACLRDLEAKRAQRAKRAPIAALAAHLGVDVTWD